MLLGLMACTPEVAVIPGFGSARGGDEVVIEGRHGRKAQVRFGQAPADVLDSGLRQLTALTPANTAGWTPVYIERWDDPVGAFVYTPLELEFEQAPGWFAPTVANVRSAAMTDLDGDGFEDLALVDDAGLRVFLNQGAFVETTPVPVGNPVAVSTQDDALVVCQPDRGTRLLALDEAVWTDRDAPPAETGCAGIWGLTELRGDGLRIWPDRPAATSTDGACTPLDGTCEVSNGVALLSAGSLQYTLPEGTVQVRIALEGQATANEVGIEGPLDTVAVTDLTLTLTADRVSIDRIDALDENGDVFPIDDFQSWSVDIDYPGIPVTLGDDLAVGGAHGVELFRDHELVPGAFSASCPVGALSRTRQGELFVGCDGQDQLYVNDGVAWFEDGAQGLPLDDAEASAVAAVDLDRDGLDELVVGGRGAVDRLYHSDGAGYDDWSARLGLQIEDTVAVLASDVDGDGDTDLVMVRPDAVHLLIMAGD